jgi:recombination protein RecA
VSKAPPKKTLAERTVASLRKHFKSDDVALLMKEGGYAHVDTVSPTGIEVLDRHVIGIGGLPYGRIVELKGDEGAGKTTLLSKFMGAAQADGALVAFRDAEHKFNPAWGIVHGLNVEDLVLLQGETLEDFHLQALHLLHTVPKGPLVIALDSIANVATKREIDEGKEVPAEHARLWPPFLRKASELAARRKALLLFVNQMRSKVGVMYGPTDTTFAGRALKHAYSLRLHVSHGKSINEGGQKPGRYMHVMADKNQLASPFRKATLMLDYLTGFDDGWATLEHAKEMGCIEKDVPFIPKNVAEARANLGWA